MSIDETPNAERKKLKRYSADFKLKIVEAAKEEGVYSVCRKYDVSNSMVYKWKNAFESHGIEGLTRTCLKNTFST